jgi:uncharacterized iron-regulated membrane protein
MLKFARMTHMYLGVFLAPSILFFAFTGALQSFSLHESHSATYTPPRWLVHMSQMHKNQTFHVPVRPPAPPKPTSAAKLPPAASRPAATPANPVERDIHAPSPMKFFFVFVALGLIVSTCLGLYMSYKFNRNKIAVTATLLAGIAVPALLTLF